MDGTPVEIVAVREVGPETVELELQSPPAFDARPGQFIQLRGRPSPDGPVDTGENATTNFESDLDPYEEPVTRHYSISSPMVAETFSVTVGIDPDGTLTPWLASRSPGDVVDVAGPFGRVFYDDEDAVVVYAAGPGIGAALGVAERAIIDGGRAALVYRLSDESVLRTGGFTHERRLAGLSMAGAGVFVVGTDQGFSDAVTTTVHDGQLFVYGFEPFVETTTEELQTHEIDPDEAKIENFG